MSLGDFVRKQFIDVIEWGETGDGVLSYRFPMRDREIQNGAMLTVRESQAAAFVNEGRIADVFGPGLHRLDTRNLPLLTDLMNWSKLFESPFKSDVFFFSTRLQVDQRWGTATPITVRDPEFGAVALRAYGTSAYRVADPRTFFLKVCGTRDVYRTEDLAGQLRATIVAGAADVFAASGVSFLDMAASQASFGAALRQRLDPAFKAFGLALDSFVVESISLPEELQSRFNERVGIGMVGDLGKYAQFEAAKSLATAAANEGGAAGTGVGLGAGIAMGQGMLGALKPPPAEAPAAAATRSCVSCGKPVPQAAKFCPECGTPQS
jgi:membrane protease subunit (stomatin/prohibitin family)